MDVTGIALLIFLTTRFKELFVSNCVSYLNTFYCINEIKVFIYNHTY